MNRRPPRSAGPQSPISGAEAEAEEQSAGLVVFVADWDEAEVLVETDRPGVPRADPEVDAIDALRDEGVEQRRHQPPTDPATLPSGQDVDVQVGRELLDDAGGCGRWLVDSPDQLLVGRQHGVCGRIGIAGAQRRPPSPLALRLERHGVRSPERVADDAFVVLGCERQVGP